MERLVTKTDDEVTIRNVLLSVSDKGGLEEFVPSLLRMNPAITFYSTGGTHARLKELLGSRDGERVKAISDYTGQPEMEGGLVKTLDYKIYLGLLSETYNGAHEEDMTRAGAVPFDMVVVNLYPFEETVLRKDATLERARSNIDIGGPCMLRSAAKNFLRVTPVCDPRDYPAILDTMRKHGGDIPLAHRFALAQKAFGHTARYETIIANYFEGVTPTEFTKSYKIKDEDMGE